MYRIMGRNIGSQYVLIPFPGSIDSAARAWNMDNRIRWSVPCNPKAGGQKKIKRSTSNSIFYF